jgi:tRNA modification GTPase
VVTRDEEIIIAQCTPAGKGALALLRLSGPQVRNLVDAFVRLASGKKIEEVSSHTIHFGWICDHAGNHIDQVMAIVMDSPKTFTGQDVIEITCHNNPFLIEAIMSQAIKHGARIAEEGEFTKRAFLNGKVDLLQAEAINELIGANTQLALKKSLSQLEGSFSHWIQGLERELVRALSWCEASFEFLDEEAEFGPQIKAQIEVVLAKIQELKKTFDAQQHIRQGIKIALIGSVNAGKSSLFNTLLNQQRAIVTTIAGTTRDVIEAGVYRDGNYWTLVDTAGLRQTQDIIEQEGIRRSFEEAQKADIIILVFDGARELTEEEHRVYQELLAQYRHKIILVENKVDLPLWPKHPFADKADLKCSTVTQDHKEVLETHIKAKIQALFSSLDSPFLLNKRQHSLLLGLEKKLITILSLLDSFIQYELVSYHLKDALEHISELTGRSISEAGMDMVFKEFCVGK